MNNYSFILFNDKNKVMKKIREFMDQNPIDNYSIVAQDTDNVYYLFNISGRENFDNFIKICGIDKYNNGSELNAYLSIKENYRGRSNDILASLLIPYSIIKYYFILDNNFISDEYFCDELKLIEKHNKFYREKENNHAILVYYYDKY